jgi:hypothetical protein
MCCLSAGRATGRKEYMCTHTLAPLLCFAALDRGVGFLLLLFG